MIEALDRDHGLSERLRFEAGPGDLVCARLEHPGGVCRVALHGGQVLSWIPTDAEEVLFLSDSSHLDGVRAIRGGIPICWPWFGDRRGAPEAPQHGFARTSRFEVRRSFEDDRGVGLELELDPVAQHREFWPHPFSLRIRVIAGTDLHVELETENTGSEAFTMGAALHTYFRVGDAERIAIDGLAGNDYLDKVRDFARDRQHEPPRIRGEVDRVYLDTSATCAISDPVLGRRIDVAKEGSLTTVLWNPGPEKAKSMTDFDNDGYREMVCIEAVNAFDDQRTLAPGERHELSSRFRVTPLA